MFWEIDNILDGEKHPTKGSKRNAAKLAACLLGRNICFGGGSSPSPDPLIGQAAMQNAQISKEALAWYKQQYTDGEADRIWASNNAKKVAAQQMAISDENQAISRDYWNYQKDTFRPLEGQIVADAQNYDTYSRRENEAGKAIADVHSQFDGARDQVARNAAAMGINPNSGNFSAQQRQTSIAEAVASAGAGNQARNNIEIQGYARRMDAANMGRNLASNQATSAGVALNAGNNSVGNSQVPLQIQQNAANMMQNGFNTAIQGNQSAANLMQGQYNAQLGAYNSNQQAKAAMVGALAGSAATVGSAIYMKSDKNSKKQRKPVSGKDALAAIENTPVESWTYKEGEGDGGSHIGPMAQDVQKNMGDSVAPRGKVIDIISANGINMAAIKELSKRVQKLEGSRK